MMKAKEEKT